MTNKKQITNFLCQISACLENQAEHQAVVNFAVNIGVINGQMIQVDLTGGDDLKMEGITFGESGVGKIVANALYGVS